ncbi:MAG TPA: cytochrome d ubiquinol oxidase subunit II [Streptosporangiaceae bacterium]|jgi:cytochrome d ubiquinol oxidase subunit II
MDYLWMTMLALLVVGWFVLEGFGVGAALVAPRVAPAAVERRRLLTAYGPFLLANEMWLVAAAGLLVGAFGTLEARVLSGLYAVFVPLLAAWVLRDASVWLRSRRPGALWRRMWDRTFVASGAVFAACTGLVLGNVAMGVPGSGMVSPVRAYGPYPLLCAATMAVLFALHGAVFLRARLTGDPAARAASAARRLAPIAAGLSLVAVAVSLYVTASPYALIALAAPAAALLCRTRAAERPGRAFAWSALAVAAPVAAVGAGTAGTVLAAVDASEVARTVLPPALAVVLVFQALLWWLFRRPVTGRAAAFF